MASNKSVRAGSSSRVFAILINVVAPIVLVAVIGYVWGVRKQPFDALSFSMVSTYVGTPCLVVDSLSTSGLDLETLTTMAGAAVLCVALALAAGYVLVRAAGLDIATYLPSTTFANNGNIGLPLALFAFGQQGMSLAIAYFAVFNLFNFIIGEGLASGQFTIRRALFSPLVWATLLGSALSVSHAALPLVFSRSIHILAGLTIPMMLLALGVSLSTLEIKSLKWPLAISILRLFGGYAIGWGVAWAFGFTGVARGVIVLESAMPAAVYNYMFAARYNNAPEEVAGLVVLSTLIGVFALPLFLLSVM